MATHPRCAKVPVNRLHPRRFSALRSLRASVPSVPAGSGNSAPGRAERYFPAYRFLAVAAAALLALCPAWRSAPPTEAPDAGVALAETPEAPALSDASTGEEWASLPIPAKPMPNQETRCEPKRGEVSIRGGCYLELKTPPPCAEGQFEHDKRCWMAVGKRARPGQAISEDVP